MNFSSFLYIVLVIKMLCHTSAVMAKTDFPTQRVIHAYRTQVNGTISARNSFVAIKQNTVSQLTEPLIAEILPTYRLYFLIIRNGFPWDYNGGFIRTICAISTVDSCDIRFLLPLDISADPTNFFSLFYAKSIIEKENVCKLISSFCLKISKTESFYCRENLKDISQEAFCENNILIVSTSWTNECVVNIESTKKRKVYLNTKRTTFTFDKDKLINVGYNDWTLNLLFACRNIKKFIVKSYGFWNRHADSSNGFSLHSLVTFDSTGRILSDYYTTIEIHSGFDRKVQVFHDSSNNIIKYCFIDKITQECWHESLEKKYPVGLGGSGLHIDNLPSIDVRLNPAAYLAQSNCRIKFDKNGRIKKITEYADPLKRKRIREWIFYFEFY